MIPSNEGLAASWKYNPQLTGASKNLGLKLLLSFFA
jgi:hypothetical protein